MPLPPLIVGSWAFGELEHPYLLVRANGQYEQFGTWHQLTMYYRQQAQKMNIEVSADRFFVFSSATWREVANPSFGN